MWPTSVNNLGIGVALCSASLIGDWKVMEPVNQRLWAVGRILHLPSGNLYGQFLVVRESVFCLFLSDVSFVSETKC